MNYKDIIIIIINIIVGCVLIIGIITTFVDGSGLIWAISSAVILIIVNVYHKKSK